MHILIVEHNPERWRSIAAALSGAGHRTEVVNAGSAALAALARPAAPDLVLIEERMTDMPALDFLQAAVRMATPAPVVVLGNDETASRWVEATRLGALDFIVTDNEGHYLNTLVARLEAACQRNATRDSAARLADALASTAAAVLIADRSGQIEYMNVACARLLGRKSSERATGNLSDLFPLESEPRVKADLFAAVDVGGEWAGEVHVRNEQKENVPCIVTLSPVRRTTGRIDGLVLTLRDVSDRVAMEDALRGANRRLAEQASRDALTGLYNRAYFREVLDREMARAIRYGDSLAVLMVDQDHFKKINDQLGHAVGDAVICDVARTLRAGLRDGDVLARYGGDEFCVLLPNTNRDEARVVAERLRENVANMLVGPDRDTPCHVSIGLATSEDAKHATGKPTDALLTLADDALFVSKRAGGNVVSIWEPPEEKPEKSEEKATT